MNIDEMQAIRKQRGLLNINNPVKSKIDKPQKEQSLEKTENNNKNIQVKFIKKISHNLK